MSRKLKYLVFLLIFGLSFWVLSGSISSSKEKATPNSIWSSFSQKEDKDQDGLTNEEEKKLGTDENNPDTDGDKILDGIEVKSGYDPMKKMAEDPKSISIAAANTNSNANVNTNSNANTNSNSNSNTNSQNAVLVNPNVASGVAKNDNAGGTASDSEALSKLNYTERTMLKTDEIVAKYNLQTVAFEQLDADKKAKVEQEVAEFIESMLTDTGLNFAFNVPDSKINIREGEMSSINYLAEVKSIFRKHSLVREDQNIEDGIREMIAEIYKMSSSDLDWGKIAIWKQEMSLAEDEVAGIAIPLGLKDLHVRVLRITGAMNIVLKNIQEEDYFKAFVSAGRAERVEAEIKKFLEEVEKIKNK